MKVSTRNPLVRSNEEEFNKIVGSLGEEIEVSVKVLAPFII